MTYRHVIWDLGGTLVDTYPEVDMALAHATFSSHPTDTQLHEVRQLRAISIRHAIITLTQRYHLHPDILNRAYHEVLERWEHTPAPLMPGARQVLDAVHRGNGLNLIVTHRDSSSAQLLLDGLRIDASIDDMICAPSGWPRKPDPTMLCELLARHHIDPSQTIGVGDRLIDGQAARAAGCRGILFDPDSSSDSPDAIRELSALLPLMTR
ncbi:HAD-IA family hydrolase [Trueperella sp. LYQ143]|uniref:HAD-IA family hydrolase n=1 Tax=unclassified Trueperella TaxID=2630174 RepID=UPI0039832474